LIAKISRWVRIAEYVYLTAMVIISIAISVTGVFFRYVVGSSLSWVEEIAGFILVGVIIVGASVAIKDKRHIRVEILPQFSPSFRRAADLIANIVGLAVMILLFALSIQFVCSLLLSGQKTASLEWLYMGLPLIIMPIGYLLGVFRFIENIFHDLYGYNT
jgi:TRAP-type C4-dicarboxylate transport system permease small subunit